MTLFPSSLHLPARRDIWLPALSGHRVAVPEAPRCLNPERRHAAAASLRAFKRLYFTSYALSMMNVPKWVEDPLGKFHAEFLDELEFAIRAPAILYRAWAVSRGLGKTTDAEVATAWAICYQLRKLVLWISVNGPDSEKRVGAVKHIFETNPLLREDFPELIDPILKFNGDARAIGSSGNLLLNQAKMVWTASDLKFSNGCRVSGRGIDGQIRGFNIDMLRPDLVFPDDIEDEKTVASEAETLMRRKKMEKEVSALGGQGDEAIRCSYVLIGTIPAQGCLTDEYTDQNKRPDWNGQRRGAMLTPPERKDLWDKFCELVRAKKDDETDAEWTHFQAIAADVAPLVRMSVESFLAQDFGMRRGLEYYAANKLEMDAGCDMLEPIQLPVWKWYWNLANKGESFVASELQCAPLAPEGTEEKVLNGEYILKRRTRTPAFVVPHWARYTSAQVDVQKHCVWVEVDAWNAELDTGQVMEFRKIDTGMNRDGSFDALRSVDEKRRRVDQVIFDTLMRLHAYLSQGHPHESTGEMIYPSICGVDCGGTTPLEKDEAHAWYKSVLTFCEPRHSGGKWIPLKGEKWTKSIEERAIADGNAHWILEEKSLAHGRRDCHTDYYKSLHYDALQITGQLDERGIPIRGAKLLHADTGSRLADDQKSQVLSDVRAYAKHCAAEKFVATFKDASVDKNDHVGWQLVSKGRRDNHGWDTGWMGYALKDMLAARLSQPRRRPPPAAGNMVRNFSHS